MLEPWLETLWGRMAVLSLGGPVRCGFGVVDGLLVWFWFWFGLGWLGVGHLMAIARQLSTQGPTLDGWMDGDVAASIDVVTLSGTMGMPMAPVAVN